MVLLSAAVKGVPVDTVEAARIDGASERQTFFKVVAPQIKGTIITVYITVLIGVMKVFDIVYVMTNGNFNTNVLGNEFWNQLNTNFNNGAAAAIVVILMIAVIPIMPTRCGTSGRGGQRMTFPATTVIDETPKASATKAMGGGHGDVNPSKAGWGTKIFLLVICVLWMVPIFGTFVTSFRTYDDANTSGWWTVFSDRRRWGT